MVITALLANDYRRCAGVVRLRFSTGRELTLETTPLDGVSLCEFRSDTIEGEFSLTAKLEGYHPATLTGLSVTKHRCGGRVIEPPSPSVIRVTPERDPSVPPWTEPPPPAGGAGGVGGAGGAGGAGESPTATGGSSSSSSPLMKERLDYCGRYCAADESLACGGAPTASEACTSSCLEKPWPWACEAFRTYVECVATAPTSWHCDQKSPAHDSCVPPAPTSCPLDGAMLDTCDVDIASNSCFGPTGVTCCPRDGLVYWVRGQGTCLEADTNQAPERVISCTNDQSVCSTPAGERCFSRMGPLGVEVVLTSRAFDKIGAAYSPCDEVVGALKPCAP